MITLILRSIIIYCIVLFAVRVMGKRQIGDMQPFELVVTLIIADLACIPMSDSTIPIVFGIVPLFTLVILHHIFTILNLKCIFFRKLINGKPIIVINQNGIDYDALKKLNMTVNDLTEGLRSSQCFNIENVAYAIVETNGNINVLLKSNVSPATNDSLNIKTEPSNISMILVNDGKIMNDNLKLLKLDEDFIKNILKKEKIKSEKDLIILSVTGKSTIFLQQKNKKSKVININQGENQ